VAYSRSSTPKPNDFFTEFNQWRVRLHHAVVRKPHLWKKVAVNSHRDVVPPHYQAPYGDKPMTIFPDDNLRESYRGYLWALTGQTFCTPAVAIVAFVSLFILPELYVQVVIPI
jgi:hypothetical protein